MVRVSLAAAAAILAFLACIPPAAAQRREACGRPPDTDEFAWLVDRCRVNPQAWRMSTAFRLPNRDLSDKMRCSDLGAWAAFCGYRLPGGGGGGQAEQPREQPRRQAPAPVRTAPVEPPREPVAPACPATGCIDQALGDPEGLTPGTREWAEAHCGKADEHGQRWNQGDLATCAEAFVGVYKAMKQQEQAEEEAGSECISIDAKGTFFNTCGRPVIVTFRTVGGGCFMNGPGSVTIAANGHTASAANMECDGRRPERGEWNVCDLAAWNRGACRLEFRRR